MLGTTQKWIKTNAAVYAQMAKKDAEIRQILDDNTKKMNILKQKADDLKSKAEAARIAHDKKVANLESQISILKTRLEAEIESSKKKIAAAKAESKSGRKNPFATASGIDLTTPLSPEKVKLSNEYAIMEITGQGEELAAKLINTEGDVFMAKVGTTLRNGFTIDEITQTYLSAVKDNAKDVLYFSAGGILDREPIPSDITIKQPYDPDNPNAGGNNGGNPSRGRPDQRYAGNSELRSGYVYQISEVNGRRKRKQQREQHFLRAAQNEQPKKQSAKDFIEGLFANDNYLCTMPKAKLPDGSALNINDETRRRLALFADGTLLISKDHRFDGPVLSFLSIGGKEGDQDEIPGLHFAKRAGRPSTRWPNVTKSFPKTTKTWPGCKCRGTSSTSSNALRQ